MESIMGEREGKREENLRLEKFIGICAVKELVNRASR